MKTSSPGFIFKLIRHLILCFFLLSFTVMAKPLVEYTQPPTPVEGHLILTGSVALSNLMTYLTQAFSERNPLITVTIADAGGTAGIESLINGTADIALIDGTISRKEQEAFEARFGYRTEVVTVAMDAVAVYVNDANPLSSITLQDLDAVFSATHRCGEDLPIQRWGALGVTGDLAQERIRVYGLTVDNEATTVFRETALCGGDFIKEFQALAGPEAVESAISSDIAGIGFSSSAMRSSRMHAVAVAPHKDVSPIAPTSEAIRSRQYPMSRILGIAVNRPRGKPLSSPLAEFIHFVLSMEGQGIVTKAGYVSLP